jgi:GAF domain-containing protein/heme/copper-type cytochrome/quinol oxidase subunit 4
MGNDELNKSDNQFSQLEIESPFERTRREQLLSKLIVGQTFAVAFLALMIAIGGSLTGQADLFALLPLAAIAIIVGLASFLLLRQYGYSLAGYIFVLGTSIAITANIAIRGYRDASAIYYLWPILSAALVLDAKGGVLVALFSAVSYFVAIVAQELGYQSPPLPYDPQADAFFTVGSRVMMFFLLAFLAWLTSKDLSSALQQTRETVRRFRELNETLEQRIVTRTEELDQRAAELETSNRKTQRRVAQLEASAEVARSIASVLDTDQLLEQVVHLISKTFEHYHTGVFLLDGSGRWAVLRAASSEGGRRMLAKGHRLEVGAQGIVGNVTRTRKTHIARNVGADTIYYDNPYLPETRTEIALPLISHDRIIGALDIQSTEEDVFDEMDVAVLTTLAGQIAVALDNARLYEVSQSALEQVQAAQRQFTHRAWREHSEQQSAGFIEYRHSESSSLDGEALSALDDVLAEGTTTITVDENGKLPTVITPIKLRGAVIGALGLEGPGAETGGAWSEEEIALIETVADQVAQAMEAARLFDETERRAQREQLVTQFTDKIRAAPDMDSILRTAVQEIRRTLGVSHGAIRLGTEKHLRPPEAGRSSDANSDPTTELAGDSKGGHLDE